MKKILHFEESDNIASMVKKMLEGYEYKHHKNSDISLSELKWANLVILDLKLNEKGNEYGGFNLLKRLKDDKIKAKVIILSGMSDMAIKAKNEYSSMIKATVHKPFLKKELLAAIKKGFK